MNMEVNSISLAHLSNLLYEAKNDVRSRFLLDEESQKEDNLSDILDITKENMLALNVKPGSLKEVIQLFNTLKTDLLNNPSESLAVQGHINPQSLIDYL